MTSGATLQLSYQLIIQVTYMQIFLTLKLRSIPDIYALVSSPLCQVYDSSRHRQGGLLIMMRSVSRCKRENTT
jgi:hypothetical protein